MIQLTTAHFWSRINFHHQQISLLKFLPLTNFLFSVYGCPWEGRGFAAVRRHGLTELMDIDCENGTKLYHVCGDESVGSVCRDNGNWECDPRCIPDNDPSKLLIITDYRCEPFRYFSIITENPE